MRAFIRRVVNGGKSPEREEHLTGEEVIGKPAPPPSPDEERLRRSAEFIERQVRAHGAWFPGDSVVRGDSFDEVLEEIRRRWSRTR